MDNYQKVSGGDVLSYSTLVNAYGALAGNYYYSNGCVTTTNQQMKESKKELFKIVMNKTTVKEYVFEVLAEDEATAKEMIEEGNTRCEKESIVSEVVEMTK